MYKRIAILLSPLLIAAGLFAFHPSASGQGNPTCPTRSSSDNSNACASTAFVQNVSGGIILLLSGQGSANISQGQGIVINNVGNISQIAIANLSVTSGGYGSSTQSANLSINAQGQVYAAGQTLITPAYSSITGTPTVRQVLISPAYWVNANPLSPAACGPTGASVCSPGSDSNNGLAPATPFLTMQHAIDTIIGTIDLANTSVAIYPAQVSATSIAANYNFSCLHGPVIGTSVISIQANSLSPQSTAFMAGPSGVNPAVATVKDGCTVGLNNLILVDNLSNNATTLVNTGTGNYGHVDIQNVSAGALAIGTAFSASYGGSITIVGSNGITGNENAVLSTSGGGVIDIVGTINGLPNLNFNTGFAVEQSGGIILDVVSPTSITGFAGATGPRCVATGPANFGADPNGLFPGNVACTAVLSNRTAKLASDVSLNNTSTYFDGPSVAQGTESFATWLVTGAVTLTTSNGGGADIFRCKLWDGTTVKNSGQDSPPVGSAFITMTLTGVFTGPAGNIRISCRDITSISGTIVSNTTNNGVVDSVINALRIN